MNVYMKSMKRHFDEVWMEHRYPGETEAGMQAALAGLMFNVMGYYHELLKIRPLQDFDGIEPTPEMKARQDNLKEPGDLHEANCAYPANLKEARIK